MQEYSPNESQYSKQQIYGYNHRKLKKQTQKQNTKIDVWIMGIQTLALFCSQMTELVNRA